MCVEFGGRIRRGAPNRSASGRQRRTLSHGEYRAYSLLGMPICRGCSVFFGRSLQRGLSKRLCRWVRQQNREAPFLVPVHAFFLSQPLFDWLCRCLESDPGHTQPTNTDITVFRRWSLFGRNFHHHCIIFNWTRWRRTGHVRASFVWFKPVWKWRASEHFWSLFIAGCLSSGWVGVLLRFWIRS